MPGEGGAGDTFARCERMKRSRRAGRGRPRVGAGRRHRAGEQRTFLLYRPLGLSTTCLSERSNEPGSPPSSAGGSRFTRMGVGLRFFFAPGKAFSTGAPSSSLSTLLGGRSAGRFFWTRAPDAEAPPTRSVSCSSEDTIVPSALAHSRRVPMELPRPSTRVSASVRLPPRVRRRTAMCRWREKRRCRIAPRRGPPRLSGHTLVWGNPTVVSTSHNSSNPPRLEISARHLAAERSRGSPLQSNFLQRCRAVLSRPGRDHPIDGCRVRRVAGARGRVPISRTPPALTR